MDIKLKKKRATHCHEMNNICMYIVKESSTYK